MFTYRHTLIAAALAVVGCRSQAPAAPSSPASQTQEAQVVKQRPVTRASAIIIRVPAKGGTPSVYRLPGLQEMPNVLRGRLPPVAAVVGLDPESEMLFVTTPKGEVLGYDLESGRVDTVATAVAQAALGPDGTLFTVDAKKHVVSLERRVRFAWPQPLAATPRQLFGASDGRLIAIVTQDQPRVITAASDQPPAVRDLTLSGDVAITRWGELLAVASDSGVTLVDPFARRAPAFVPLADHPRALAFSPAGHRLYVARRTSPGLAVIDRFERKEIDGVALPMPAANLRVDGFGRWLLARPAAGDSVWIVDLPIKRLVGAVPAGWSNDLPDVSPDGALVVRSGADVAALQPDSLKESGRVAGGAADQWVLSTWLPRGSLRALADAAQGVTPAGDTTGGALYVQVSVSQNQDWSTEMAQQLTRAGLAARVLPPAHPDDGYRVVLGPYPTREQAEAIGRKLGRPFWIYQPGQ